MGMNRRRGMAFKRPTQVRCCACGSDCCNCPERISALPVPRPPMVVPPLRPNVPSMPTVVVVQQPGKPPVPVVVQPGQPVYVPGPTPANVPGPTPANVPGPTPANVQQPAPPKQPIIVDWTATPNQNPNQPPLVLVGQNPPPSTPFIPLAPVLFNQPASSGEENVSVATGQTTPNVLVPISVSGLGPKISASGSAHYHPAGQAQFVPLYADRTGALYYPAGQAADPKGPGSTQQTGSDGTGKPDPTQGTDPRIYDVVGQGIGVTGAAIIEAIRQGNETERARIQAQVQQAMQNTMSQSGLSEAERQQQVASQQAVLLQLQQAQAQQTANTAMTTETKTLIIGGVIFLVVLVGGIVLYMVRKNPGKKYLRNFPAVILPPRKSARYVPVRPHGYMRRAA